MCLNILKIIGLLSIWWEKICKKKTKQMNEKGRERWETKRQRPPLIPGKKDKSLCQKEDHQQCSTHNNNGMHCEK